MKKMIFAILIFSFAFKAQSQQNISLGPIAGFGHSWLSNNSDDGRFMPSYNAGLTLIYSYNPNWGFGGDIKFSGEGAKSFYESGGSNYKSKLRLNYIRVPLKAIYFFEQWGDRARPKIMAGPTFGFLVGGSQSLEINGTEAYDRDIDKDDFNGFDFGLQIGTGINVRIASNTWLNTDVSYMHGLTKIYENAADRKNRNLQLSFGVAFGIGTARPAAK